VQRSLVLGMSVSMESLKEIVVSGERSMFGGLL